MKKFLTLLSATVILSLLVFSSCSKKKDPTPTKEQFLARVTGWKQTAGVAGSTDNFSDEDACEKDNILKFVQTGSTSAGTYTFDEGASKCDSGDPQTSDSGTWAFNSAKTQLTINSGGDEIILTVVTLNATTLVISYQADSSNGDVTVTETYTGQ